MQIAHGIAVKRAGLTYSGWLLVAACGLALLALSPFTEAATPSPDEAQGRVIDLTFEELDLNADHLLSPEEASQLPELAERLPDLDIDQDGMLNRTEFSKFKPAGEDLQVLETQVSFEELDTNADNLLSKQEASRVPELAERLPDLDIDQDGMLNRTEFSKFEPESQ